MRTALAIERYCQNYVCFAVYSLFFIILTTGCVQNQLATSPTSASSPTATATDTPRPLVTNTPIVLDRLALINVNLNVRRGPGAAFEVIGLLNAGSEATIIGENDDQTWWKIVFDTASDGIGWVSAEYTTLVPQPTVVPASEASTVIVDQGNLIEQTTIATSTTVPYQIQLSVSPNTINVSECARLRYEVIGLSEVTIDGQIAVMKNGRGTQVVCPTVDTIFTLSGIDDAGNLASQTVLLHVIAATPTPLITDASIPVSTTPGCSFAVETLGINDSSQCRFSPDGLWVAAPADDGSLWVVGVDGSQFDEVVNAEGRFFITGDIAWSPDGSQLAFSSVGLDGLGIGIGIVQFGIRTLAYYGPDATVGEMNNAEKPRWTEDGQLVVTWYATGLDTPGVVGLFDPIEARPRALRAGIELQLSTSGTGQRVYPWQAGRSWIVGRTPTYHFDP